MSQGNTPPRVSVQQAQELVEQTAARLHRVLVELSASLVPFPYFLGSLDIQAVEAEPGRSQTSDRGCVVVCPDGELYELTVKLASPEGTEFGLERNDSVTRIDLPPEEYVVYALHAIQEVGRLLVARNKA